MKEWIWTEARAQLARDLSCGPEVFLSPGISVSVHSPDSGLSAYLPVRFPLHLARMGERTAAACDRELVPEIEAWLNHLERPEFAFSLPEESGLSELLAGRGKMRHMGMYFLPDPQKLQGFKPKIKLTLRLLGRGCFEHLYLPEWRDALCWERKYLDQLVLGAWDGETLMGLAGVSSDCPVLWQLGINVLPAYRGRGIAAALVNALALEVLSRGKVPFYGLAPGNIRSMQTAVRAGFEPAWIQMTADYVQEAQDEKV